MTSFYSREELLELGFARLGEDVQISRKTSIYSPEKMSFGDHVRIDDFCVLSGSLTIGNYVHIAVSCLLFGGNSGIEFCDFSGLSSRVAVYAESDDYGGDSLTNPLAIDEHRHIIKGRVTFCKHAVIGTGCTILPGVIVAEGCAVGAMALVAKSTEPWGIYMGIPCKRLKERKRGLLEYESYYTEN